MENDFMYKFHSTVSIMYKYYFKHKILEKQFING